MAKPSDSDTKYHPTFSRPHNPRVQASFAARGLVDRDIQQIVDDEIVRKGCTELDMSENLITQRGASILGNLLGFNKVNQKPILCSILFFMFNEDNHAFISG